jgi:two-component system KDP operon response regulator KdpE
VKEVPPVPTKALLIAHEPDFRRLLKLMLEAEGYAVRAADQGLAGLSEAALSPPELVILDLGLPDLPGVEAIRRLRGWSDVPVMALSVRADSQEKIGALDAGADDCLTKPFDPSELFARLRVLRRRQHAGSTPAIVRFGSVQVDLNARVVKKSGEEIGLTSREYNLLSLLAKNRGKIITHKQILASIWGPACDNKVNYLRIYMARLREKLEDKPNQPKYLLTTSRLGYRLSSQDGSAAPPGADIPHPALTLSIPPALIPHI